MSYLPLNSVRNITNAAAKLGGLAFDGVTDCKVLHTAASVGTSDFTVSGTFLFPTTLPATACSIIGLTSSPTNMNVAYGLAVTVDPSSGFTVLFFGSSNTVYRKRYLPSAITEFAGKLVHYAVVRSASGASLTVYLNGVAQTMSSSDTASPPSFSDTIDSTYVLQGRYTTGYYNNTTVFGAQVFNRALSASEVITLANQGVQEADKWGSLTAKYTSDFSAGVGPDPWLGSNGAVAGNIDGIGGENDWLRFTTDGVNGTHKAAGPASSSVVAGKRYIVSVRYYVPSSNSTMTYASIWYGAGAVKLSNLATTDAATTYTSAEFTASASGTIQVYGLAGTSFQDPGADDVFYIKSVTVTEVGAILDADLSAGIGYQVPDRSSNSYHGLISTSGTSWTLPIKNQKAIFTASSSGYLGDATSRVVIPSNARINSITAYSASGSTFSLGDDSGASTNLVSSVAISAATLTDLTLLKRYATTSTAGRIYVAFSSANSTTFTIDYSITATS